MAKRDEPLEVFMPPNLLKAKVGGTGGVFDASALKAAESALDEFKEEFGAWLIDDVNRLTVARDAYAADQNDKTRGAFYRAAHDLKGQGKTFDFPLVARVAGSLCKLVEESNAASKLPANLLDAHVDAIKIIVRDGIKDPANKTASTLALELERRVLELVGPKAGA
jgi:chemotaxis protein histidine kinase CheA